MKHYFCYVNGCEGAYCAKGYCNRHYLQMRNQGYTTPLDDRKAIIENGYAKIPLNKHARKGYTIVDIKDSWVDEYRWFNHHGYAETGMGNLSMQRLLMEPPEDTK